MKNEREGEKRHAFDTSSTCSVLSKTIEFHSSHIIAYDHWLFGLKCQRSIRNLAIDLSVVYSTVKILKIRRWSKMCRRVLPDICWIIWSVVIRCKRKSPISRRLLIRPCPTQVENYWSTKEHSIDRLGRKSSILKSFRTIQWPTIYFIWKNLIIQVSVLLLSLKVPICRKLRY